jgi:putative methionine-R-sulfoxide reductase with GAF domain
MTVPLDALFAALAEIVSRATDRAATLKSVADFLKTGGGYRWVGLYDVDHAAQVVRNVAWSGQGAPEYPVFPLTQGLTGAVIAGRETLNVGDVSADPRYLTAFGTTRSEMIVPVLDETGRRVAGTIERTVGNRALCPRDSAPLGACAVPSFLIRFTREGVA